MKPFPLEPIALLPLTPLNLYISEDS